MEVKLTRLCNYFDLSINELSKILYETNSFIAGSAPLNVFVEDKLYDNMDLDIFMRITHYELKEKYSKMFNSYLKLNGYVCTSKNDRYYSLPNEINRYILQVATYFKRDKKIQLICLDACPIGTFLGTFDLNICKLVLLSLNGTELTLYRDHLTDEQINEIKDKKMYVSSPITIKNVERLRKRIDKYIERCFAWLDHNTFEEVDIHNDADPPEN
jgi:hypothetical protein